MSKIIGRFEPMTEGFRSFDVVSMSSSSFMNDPGYEGEKPDGSRFHVFTRHWKWIPVWTGEGLPPVGIEIEWESDYGWIGGKVVGHDQTVTIVRHNCGYSGIHPHQVRPIRTPEQIAAEECAKAIDQMVIDSQHPIAQLMRDSIFAELYAQGYRKFEIVDN